MSDEKEMPDASYDATFYRDMKAKDKGFYGHAKVETSYTVVGNNQPRTPDHPQDSFYRNVKNPIGKS